MGMSLLHWRSQRSANRFRSGHQRQVSLILGLFLLNNSEQINENLGCVLVKFLKFNSLVARFQYNGFW